MAIQKDRVKFNVGSKIFETTGTTLAVAGRESYFGALFDENWNLLMNPVYEHFIDRNPHCFSILLDLLRSGELHIPQNVPKKLLYREAQFYGLTDRVQAATWGPFDGNRLQPTKSITGWATGDVSMIRASPDGGCCVVHGSVAHIYDWTLEEHAPIKFDNQKVKDVCWVGPEDPTGILFSTCGLNGHDQGGLRLFNSTTGELIHKFNVTHKNVVESCFMGAITSHDDWRVFSSCRSSNVKEHGIGVWDINTGQQLDFFYQKSGWSLGEADKLQWLNGKYCLLVATLCNKKNNSFIRLLDFRSKSMVWSWSEECYLSNPARRNDRRVRDLTAIEENNSICVVDGLEDLGFLDMRSTYSDYVQWSSGPGTRTENPHSVYYEPCHPKIEFHKGQLLLSINDRISVFSGTDWALTSKLRSSGGSIGDFSIGGDRLFALHKDNNLFDIWDSPPSSIQKNYL